MRATIRSLGVAAILVGASACLGGAEPRVTPRPGDAALSDDAGALSSPPTDAGAFPLADAPRPEDHPSPTVDAPRPQYEAIDEDVPAPFAVAPLDASAGPEPTVGVVSDLDGDGSPEVMLSVVPVPNGGASPRTASVYRVVDGALVPSTTVRAPEAWTALGAVDLDGDGANDLVGTERSRAVAWARGDGTFADPVALEARPPFPVGFGGYALDDLDDDGWLDLLAVHDDCVPGVVEATCCEACASLIPLLRDGPRSFVARPDLVPQPPRLAGIAAHATRAGTGERVLVALAWTRQSRYAQVFYRQSSVGPDGFPRWSTFDPLPLGNAALEGREAPDPLASVAGWSPMGAASGDVDGDGRQDLVLALEPRLALLAGDAAWPMRDLTSTANLADRRRLPAGSPYDIPWGVALVDLDLDGDQDLVAANGIDPSAPPSTVRPQRVSAYLNDGDGAFTRVDDALGMNREGQWRALSLSDLDGDGAVDLAVGGLGELPRLYRARAEGRHGVSLRLRGTASNHYGVGARVEVWRDGDASPQTFVMGAPAGPFVLSEPMVFVGLGSARAASRVRVTWPSGQVQEAHDLAADASHTITEPELLTVSPATRSLSRFARATLTVTPRDEFGRPRAASRVTASVRGDAGAFAVVTGAGSRWAVSLRATRPGSAAVTVSVDGVELGVRPRVWFR